MEIEINKRSLMFFFIILITIFVIYVCFLRQKKAIFFEKEIKGVIVDKIRIRTGYNFKLKFSQEFETFYLYEKIEKNIIVGDSISKEMNSMIISHYENNNNVWKLSNKYTVKFFW